MQNLSDEMLIKSLGLNIFYPRDLPVISNLFPDSLGLANHIQVVFDDTPGADEICYVSKDLDELGYMRRYSRQRLFYLCAKPTRRDVLEASIYGCDGLICRSCDKATLQIMQGAGLHAGIIADGKASVLAAVAKQFNIIINSPTALPSSIKAGAFLKESACSI